MIVMLVQEDGLNYKDKNNLNQYNQIKIILQYYKTHKI